MVTAPKADKPRKIGSPEDDYKNRAPTDERGGHIGSTPVAPPPPKSKNIPTWRARAERDMAKRKLHEMIENLKPKDQSESEEESLEELTDGELKEVEKLKSWESWLEKAKEEKLTKEGKKILEEAKRYASLNMYKSWLKKRSSKKIPKKVRPESPNSENNYQTHLDKPIQWKALKNKIMRVWLENKAFRNEGKPRSSAEPEKHILEANHIKPQVRERGHGVGTPMTRNGEKVARTAEDVTISSGNEKTSQKDRQMGGVLGRKGNAPSTKSPHWNKDLLPIATGRDAKNQTEQERATATISDSNTSDKKEAEFIAREVAQFKATQAQRDQQVKEKRRKYRKKTWENWLETKKDQGQGDARYGNPHETGMEDAKKLQTTTDDFSLESKPEETKKDGKPYIQTDTDKR
jgi:hypothetical protein|tara:strand:+ start:3264 stop:4478 length:1215 start_codon:yes stop_codon:yes gene_type:complete